jgi:hypothetical protein
MRLRLLLASSVGLAAALAAAAPALGSFTYSRTGGGIVTIAAGSLPPTGSLDTLYRVTGQTNGTDCDNTPSGSAVAYCAWNGAAYAAVGVAASGLTNPLVIDLDAAGNDIVNVATVDGRDISVDGAKLDGIAAGATVGLGSNPAPCPAGQFVTDQNQSGVLTCAPDGTAAADVAAIAALSASNALKIDELADDPSPQLTADLDASGRAISGASKVQTHLWPSMATLQAAINSCQRGSTDQDPACVIHLPDGRQPVSTKIEIGTTDNIGTEMQNGFTLVGSGNGITNMFGQSLAGTTLYWTGADGGTMFEVSGFGHRLADFLIDGHSCVDIYNTPASGGGPQSAAPPGDAPDGFCDSDGSTAQRQLAYGILQSGNNANGAVTGKNVYERITITNVTDYGVPEGGYAMAFGLSDIGQNDHTYLEQIRMVGNRRCLFQGDSQAVMNTGQTIECTTSLDTPFIHIQRGGFAFDDLYVGATTGNAVGIQIDSCATEFHWHRGNVEWQADNGTVVKISDGGNGCGEGNRYAYNISEVRFLMQFPATAEHTCIDLDTRAALNLIGNVWMSDGPEASRKCDLEFHQPSTTQEASVFMAGNRTVWNYGVDVSDIGITVTAAAGGTRKVVRNDLGKIQIIDEDGSVTMEKTAEGLSLVAPEVTISSALSALTAEFAGDVENLAPVDNSYVLAPQHRIKNYFESWFGIDGAKNLCADVFNTPAGGVAPQSADPPGDAPDGWCDSGGGIRAGKTKVVGIENEVVNLTQTEAYGDWTRLLAGADTDPVGRATDVWATGGSQDEGDEGPQPLRTFVSDAYYAADGTIVGTLAAGSGGALVSLAGVTLTESKLIGENKLLVFPSNTSSGAVAQDVNLTSVPAGTIDNTPTPGTLAPGTWSTPGTKTWGIEPGLIASQGFGAGWALSPADSAYVDPNGVPLREWFEIVSCNAGANTCETSWIGQGQEFGVAYGTLAEVGTDEARIAPAVKIVEPIFNVGNDKIVDAVVVLRASGFDGTDSGAGFVVPDYPNHTMQGATFLAGRRHGSMIPHRGILMLNYTGEWGARQGGTAYTAGGVGSTSALIDGAKFHWLEGFRCLPDACETGFRHDYRNDPNGGQFAILNFGADRYAAGDTFNVLRIINSPDGYENSAAFKPGFGWGQGISTFEPFLRASVTDDSINGGVPNGAGAKVHWSQILGVPTDIVDGDDVVAGEAGDSVSINGSAVDSASGVNFRDSASIVLSHGGGADPETVEARLNYGLLQTGNPTLNAKECVFSTFGTSGGGIMCEGSTANDLEQLYKFPVLDSLDSEFFFVVTPSPITDPLSAAVAFSSFQFTNGNLTDLSDGFLTGSKVEVFTPSVGGAVPASGGGTVNFLRADGSWATPPGGGGGGTTVQVDGVAAPSPVDIQSAGDIDSILCTSAGVPDASCEALGDVIFRAKADSVALGTDTTGSYAASASEAGPALLAVALVGNGGNCAPGTYPLGVDASGAVESCTTDDDVPDAGDFGAATDLDANGAVEPDSVALGTDTTGNYAGSASEAGPATTALALSTNALNCGPGLFAKGVDAAGAAEGCEDVVVPAEVSAYTTGTSTPVDGSTACNTGDMHLETDRRVTFYCVDGATDDWWGVQLLDDVP